MTASDIICGAMARCGCTHGEMARLMRIAPSSFSRKIRRNTWTVRDIRRINRRCPFTADDLQSMVRW